MPRLRQVLSHGENFHNLARQNSNIRQFLGVKNRIKTALKALLRVFCRFTEFVLLFLASLI
ncbi:hypothetical protein BCY91_15390 [Pelobium manganitolerans]|uniref:Uncharacterized protein n=1 Tax=Pelobium manganitolerans TaxID=1842495 RepID=A0A419S8K2_9SPHI|nr:hypothetical protein BCY91_15390 [Pelobium manganitolerans]